MTIADPAPAAEWSPEEPRSAPAPAAVRPPRTTNPWRRPPRWTRAIGPINDWRFWVVQAMVAVVTAGHGVLELGGGELHAVYFLPATLYFFPVLYASVTFGKRGALPTAVWSALLSLPNVFVWHHGLERVGEGFQMGTMLVLAVVIAWATDKEIVARQQAQKSERARTESEARYRMLFDNAGEAILAIDDAGLIQEANAAAAALLERSARALRGAALGRVLGVRDLAELMRRRPGGDERVDVRLRRGNGDEVWIEPVFTSVAATDGRPLAQVLLRDVTERRGFQHYAQEIVRAQEEERQRIAQELHDVSLQTAILICRRLDDAHEATESRPPEEVAEVIADARRTAEQMADELRRFSRDLRPLILDDLGLVPALNRLVAELGDRSGLQARLSVSGSTHRMPASLELSLYRIAQEALRNVEKHSDARRVTVRLDFRGTEVRVTVTDNGQGFDVPSLTSLVGAGRLGLLGMQERARLVGGSCSIRSEHGKGARVQASVPLTALGS